MATKCILLADDNESMSYILKKACEKKEVPYPVVWVKSGEQLLDYLFSRGAFAADSRIEPGVILMDIRMPGKSTKEVLQEIKKEEGLKNIPVILWSNFAKEALSEELKQMEAQDFISKPAGFKELLDVISRITEKIK